MKIATAIAVGVLIIGGSVFGQEARQGYVLKVGEGELAAGALIKASPLTGTQGGVMILQPMAEGFSTGVHYHVEADEFFYVISGNGVATIGEEEHPIEAGDVIFIPSGQDHKIEARPGPIEMLEFLDKPGLDEEFRAWHRNYSDSDQSVTLEEINAIATQYGTVYRTIE